MTLIAGWTLAELYAQQGRYAEAESLLVETLAAQRRVFGDDHIQTIRVRRSLANIYEHMGRDEEAAALYPVQDRGAIEVDAEALETYVGRYETSTGRVFSISLANGKLFWNVGYDFPVRVFPESESDFFFRVIDAQISFLRDGSGKVIGLDYREDAPEHRRDHATRVE